MADAKLASASPLMQSKLWGRDINSLTRIDLMALLRQHKGTEAYQDALNDIDLLCNAGIRAVLSGKAIDNDAFYFTTPGIETITAGDLSSWLSETTIARSSAILFALESGWSLKEVIGMTWGASRSKLHSLPPLAFELVVSTTRHIKLDYVFWEFMSSGAAAPLFGLEETALEVSQGMGFKKLRELYKGMAMVGSDQAAAEVACHFAQQEMLMLGG
jgi:hypothetical protein